MDKETKYSTLMTSFLKLHEELLSISPADMVTLNQVFHFATAEHFEAALPNAEFPAHLGSVAK